MDMSRWRWNGKKSEAARLVAEGGRHLSEIATTLGINVRTLVRWNTHPDFCERVAEHVVNLRAAAERASIASAEANAAKRIQILQRVSDIVDDLTTDDLLMIKRNPLGAINLLLRLQCAVELFEKRRHYLYAESERQTQPETQTQKLQSLADLDPDRIGRLFTIFDEDFKAQGISPPGWPKSGKLPGTDAPV
jgi:transposase-like protein